MAAVGEEEEEEGEGDGGGAEADKEIERRTCDAACLPVRAARSASATRSSMSLPALGVLGRGESDEEEEDDLGRFLLDG